MRGTQVEYDYTVTNVSDRTLSVVPASDDLEAFTRPGPDNCGWQSLQPGESYACTTAHHVLTEDDLAAGTFTPRTTWEIRAGDYDGETGDTLTREGPTARLAVPENLVPQSRLRVADVSSEETTNADNVAAKALDGDPATFWHTDWSLTEGPHWVTLDLGRMSGVQALGCLPRPGAGNGTLKEYRIYAWVNGKYWGEPVATGTLDRSTGPSVIELDDAKGRYLKAVYVSSYSDAGRHFASAAGFNVQAVPPGARPATRACRRPGSCIRPPGRASS